MFTKDTVAPLTINAKPNTNGVFSAAAFQYIEEPPLREEPSRDALHILHQRSEGSPLIKRSQTTGMNGHLGTTAPPSMYVRALYDYESDDHTSLSFRQGDTIQVITQLASGWWDGIINGVRGWFPSNYCAIISEPDRSPDVGTPEGPTFDPGPESDGSNSEGREREEAAFWIPQATPDGRLFYFNTLTGVSTMELPLETPTSANETGPRDRMYIPVPEQTRPPAEMMASGYERDVGDYDGGDSASDLECEPLMHASRGSPPRRRRSYISDGVSPAASVESLNTSPATRHFNPSDFANPNIPMSAAQQVSASMPAIGTITTAFTSNSIGPVSAAAIPRSFFDDGHTAPLTWNKLVENMRKSVESYRQVINNSDRSEYVRKAEDISDHLRMLLGAASGTTDNHSGNPSIISTNKALYPHFRDMMSRFSKLVLSSHIAAADWHAPDSLPKCLQEAEGVLHGVYGYVEVARSQRGEEIPRLVPGFVLGSNSGGSWQNNNLGTKDPTSSTSFVEQDDYESLLEPTTTLDAKLLENMDGLKRMMLSGIRRLEEQLVVTDKLVTPLRHEQIGNAICAAARNLVGPLRSWLAAVESIDLGPLGCSLSNQQMIEFSAQKQQLYDLVMHLVVACQAVAAPLGDEWAEARGDSLEDRLNEVRTIARHLETCTSQVGYSLQLLKEIPPQEPTMQQFRDAPVESTHPRTADGSAYPDSLLSLSKQLQGQHLQDLEHSTLAGVDPVSGNYRQDNSKVERFFGEVPARNMPNRDTEEVPSFLRLDHEGEISYDMKVNPPQLRGGTLTALVEQLTRHDRLDGPFNNTFLLTYRSFTTASELFELLVKRFSIQPPRNLSAEDHKTWVDKKQKPIRFRVVNILKGWFDNFWMETADQANDQLLRRIFSFAKDSIATTSTPGSGHLMTAVEQRLKGQDANARRLVPTPSTQIPAPIMPKNLKKLKFLDIDATEFARQLTIIESGLYGKIKPTECLNKTWQKKLAPDEREPAANVKALILHSNQLTNWVAEMILNQSDVKKRVVVIKHFVSVADKCRTMNNFSTLFSIISALGTAPIHRLSRTWAQVNARTMTVLEQIRVLMSSTKNFGEYRDTLHLANPPCIPFFGVYLTDLTFIEDGIPSLIKRTNLINFAKRAKTAEVIRDIQQYQNVPYHLQSVEDLQHYILSNMQAAGDVHEMYEKSLQVEPREREDEKITRLLSESGFL